MNETSRRRGATLGRCPFCARETMLTFHHLIPKKVHRRSRFRRSYSRAQLNSGITVCRACHDGIHKRYSEMELARRFASAEALAADPDLSRHFAWVARQRRR